MLLVPFSVLFVRFVSHTLLAAQTEAPEVATACDAAMDFLLNNSFIVATQEKPRGEETDIRDPDSAVAPTQLGKVGGDSAMPGTPFWVGELALH